MSPAELVALLIAAAFANSVALDPAPTGRSEAGNRPELRELALHGVLSALVGSAAAAANWLLWQLLLQPRELQLYAGFATVLLAAGSTILAAWALPRWRPALARAQWWLVAANALVISAALGGRIQQYTFPHYLLAATAAGAGLGVALLLLAGLDRRLQQREVPAAFAGLPIRLLNAGLLALACTGLAGLGRSV
jgi:Na+-translocating ferredoxin:NAD+ oxidoreductase subunit A